MRKKFVARVDKRFQFFWLHFLVGNITAYGYLLYVRFKLERILDFFRIDVLSAFRNNHIFHASAQHKIIFLINPPQITCLEPAVFRKNFCSFFRHIIISLHNHRTFYCNLADSVFIRVKDFHFHFSDKIFSDAFNLEMMNRIKRDNRWSFRKTVSLHKINAHLVIKTEYAFCQRTAAADCNADCINVCLLKNCLKNPFTRIYTECLFYDERNSHKHFHNGIDNRTFAFYPLDNSGGNFIKQHRYT